MEQPEDLQGPQSRLHACRKGARQLSAAATQSFSFLNELD